MKASAVLVNDEGKGKFGLKNPKNVVKGCKLSGFTEAGKVEF